MTDWSNYDVDEEALAQRQEQLEEDASNFDAAKSPFLPMKWNGEYRVRIYPYLDMNEWLVQLGQHWNVFPTGDPQKPSSRDGCPSFTHHQPCPICEAILKAVSEKKAKWKDFGWEGAKINLQRSYLIRVLLLDFEPGMNKSNNKPPKFADFPLHRILQIPTSVANEFRKKVDDKKDFGFVWLTHPKTGPIIKIVKDDSKDPKDQYDVSFLTNKPYPIPEEFLDEKTWLNMEDYLPTTTTEELMMKIEKHQMDIHPMIANYALAIDADVIPEERRLEGGEEEPYDVGEDAPPPRTKSKSVQAIKDRLNKKK